MKEQLWQKYEALKARGLAPDREAKILSEIEGFEDAGDRDAHAPPDPPVFPSLYDYHDLMVLQAMGTPRGSYTSHIRSIDELIAKDKQRQEDGFPRKIRVGRMVKPGRGGKDKVVVVPSTVEDKLIHDPSFTPPEEEQGQGGSGDGEEGEVIGEQPVRETQEGRGAGPGQGDDERG